MTPAPDRRVLDPDTPVFRSILGDGFDALGPVVRRHYALRPYGRDRITVTGTMAVVRAGPVVRLLMPLFRMVGSLVPYEGTDVPVVVHYAAQPHDATIHWDRVFAFPGRAPFHFRSHMEPVGPNRVIEFVRFGVGMRLRVTAEDGALVFRDEGYLWRVTGVDLPLPAGLLLGRAIVEERPDGPDRFTMRMVLRHRLWGEMFRYEGAFALGPASSGTSQPR